MKLNKLVTALIGVTLAFSLSACSWLAPQITDDSKSGSQETKTTETKKEEKSADYTASLVGTYELDHEDFTESGETQTLTKEEYQDFIGDSGLHFTLEFSGDGNGKMTTPDPDSNTSESAYFKWKTTDGKSLVMYGSSDDDKIEATVGENGEITLEIEDDDDGSTMTMVFTKVSDKTGYYDDSSNK